MLGAQDRHVGRRAYSGIGGAWAVAGILRHPAGAGDQEAGAAHGHARADRHDERRCGQGAGQLHDGGWRRVPEFARQRSERPQQADHAGWCRGVCRRCRHGGRGGRHVRRALRTCCPRCPEDREHRRDAWQQVHLHQRQLGRSQEGQGAADRGAGRQPGGPHGDLQGQQPLRQNVCVRAMQGRKSARQEVRLSARHRGGGSRRRDVDEDSARGAAEIGRPGRRERYRGQLAAGQHRGRGQGRAMGGQEGGRIAQCHQRAAQGS